MKLKLFAVTALVLVASITTFAQQPADPAKEVERAFDEVSGWVSKAADMVPDDKYNYRPTEGVRTFGELIAHITDSYNFFCARGAGKEVQWSDPVEKGAKDKATLVPKLKQSVEACNAVYKGGTGKFRALFMNVGHTSLHYGNIITYMRMMGLKPPSS